MPSAERQETAVLSIGKLGLGQADYYVQTVAQGDEDYYTGSGEAPGRWLGRASADRGVVEQVGQVAGAGQLR